MSKLDLWMPFFIGDYLADTVTLSLEEHGLYLLLIMAYWQNKGPLPDDDAAMARRLRISPKKWRNSKAIAAQFFVIKDGNWHHKRIDQELERAKTVSEKKRLAGKASQHKRQQVLQQPFEHMHQPPHHTTPQKKGDSPPVNPPSRGSRISDDFTIPAAWAMEARTMRARNNLPPIDMRLEAERFTTYWQAQAGAKAAKRDWRKTWLNWCLNSKTAENVSRETSPRLTPAESLFAGAALALADAEARRANAERAGGDAGDCEPAQPLLDGIGPAGTAKAANGRLAH